MDAAGAWAAVQPWIEKAEVWKGHGADLETLLIYAVGIALYTALVFAFCRSISRAEAFHARPRAGWAGRLARLGESALVFPLMSMLYFALLGASLFLLAKSQTTYQILLLAMAVVLSVRVTSFLSEEMSADLAKLLPLGLLGVLLVDPGVLTLGAAWTRLREATHLLPEIARFFALFIVSEAVLRATRVGALRAAAAWRARGRRAKGATLEVVPLPPSP
jgi:small-conductance mechanosensitive channel